MAACIEEENKFLASLASFQGLFGPVFPHNRNSLELCSLVVNDTLGFTDNLGFVEPRKRFVGICAGMVVFPMCTFS